MDEVQAVLLDTWDTAAEPLPGVIGDPASLSWAAPPTTELRMACEQPADNSVLPTLDTPVDLTPLGTKEGRPRSEMAVTITTAPAMGRAERQELAVTHRSERFGLTCDDTSPQVSQGVRGCRPPAALRSL
ncbi:hypothetical protein [Streptomyces sp. NPDC046859]|uniref:hypothetical protein n=1 Tax=Streptomyces sp. NPDC046859 TaxID=3155734 RepID=UPI003407BAC8